MINEGQKIEFPSFSAADWAKAWREERRRRKRRRKRELLGKVKMLVFPLLRGGYFQVRNSFLGFCPPPPSLPTKGGGSYKSH